MAPCNKHSPAGSPHKQVYLLWRGFEPVGTILFSSRVSLQGGTSIGCGVEGNRALTRPKVERMATAATRMITKIITLPTAAIYFSNMEGEEEEEEDEDDEEEQWGG